jgi:hypothetical protein
MKSNKVETTLKHLETIDGNVKNLSKSDVTFFFIFHFHTFTTRVGEMEGWGTSFALQTLSSSSLAKGKMHFSPLISKPSFCFQNDKKKLSFRLYFQAWPCFGGFFGHLAILLRYL